MPFPYQILLIVLILMLAWLSWTSHFYIFDMRLAKLKVV